MSHQSGSLYSVDGEFLPWTVSNNLHRKYTLISIQPLSACLFCLRHSIPTAHFDPVVSFHYLPCCWLTRSSPPPHQHRHHHQYLAYRSCRAYIPSIPSTWLPPQPHHGGLWALSLLLMEAGGGNLNKSFSSVPACGEVWSFRSNWAAFNQQLLEHDLRLHGQDTKGRD